MSDEINSKIIISLLRETDPEKIKEILEEISEIGSPVFVYPLYEKWKAYGERSIAHYFIGTLGDIESESVLEVALLMLQSNVDFNEICWLYPIFKKYNCTQEPVIVVATGLINGYANGKAIKHIDIEMEFLIEYLIHVKHISNIIESLRTIVLKQSEPIINRSLCLGYLLRSDPKKEMGYLIDNFIHISSESLDTILAKEMILWTGPLSEKLRELLRTNGKGRSREIIEKFVNQSLKKVEAEQVNVEKKYNNIDLVVKIGKLRSSLNASFIARLGINFDVFEECENIVFQQEVAKSRADFGEMCKELRATIEKINKKVSSSLTPDLIAQLLPNIDEKDYGKPLNRLVLFLNANNIATDKEIYGLRELNRITSLTGHPSQLPDLIQLLKKHSLYILMEKEDWGALHKGLLEMYQQSLSALLKSINQAVEPLQTK